MKQPRIIRQLSTKHMFGINGCTTQLPQIDVIHGKRDGDLIDLHAPIQIPRHHV